MQLTVEPPLDQWQVGTASDAVRRGRASLFDLISANAQRLGSGQPADRDGAVIATGHQAWLWHPGILAKDLAMTTAATRLSTDMLHVVVDQDAHEALRLELPVVRDKQLSIELVSLGPDDPAIPTACRPPVEADVIADNLSAVQERLGSHLAVSLDAVIEAFNDPPVCETLAQQLAVALERLRRSVGGVDTPLPVLFVSQLAGLPFYLTILDRMLNDAHRCVACYNRAVASRSGAGVLPLRVERDRVELPVWLLRWGKPRQRVFADLAGQPAMFTLEDGQPIEPPLSPGWGIDKSGYVLAPRALLLTAVLRRYCCDLFIHGKGGLVYDRVTEDWWRDWLGEELAPMTAVSADITLTFDVPLSDEKALRDAQWWLHHVPHNIDRATAMAPQHERAVAEKQQLLLHMDDDRDRVRRAGAFARLHQINSELAKAHGTVLIDAQQRLEQARIGLANQVIAAKRDWCFGVYDPSVLNILADTFIEGV